LILNKYIKFKKGETKMKTLLKRFETIMMAAAFAEEGEFETAKQIMREESRKEIRPTQTKRPTERKVLRAE